MNEHRIAAGGSEMKKVWLIASLAMNCLLLFALFGILQQRTVQAAETEAATIALAGFHIGFFNNDPKQFEVYQSQLEESANKSQNRQFVDYARRIKSVVLLYRTQPLWW